jgi:hypothetical protein
MTVADQLLGRARTIAGVGLAINVVLAAANIAAGLAAGSTSAVAAGLEFGGDVIASVVVLAGLAAAARPPDDNHPYGHGRLETLAGFTVGLLLVLGGAGICYRSLQEVHEVHPPPDVIALWTLAAAIVVRLVMSGVKLRVGRRLGSGALIADGWNDAVDIVSASAAAGAVALARLDPERFLAADHYGGVLVGLVVVLTGVRVARDTSLESRRHDARTAPARSHPPRRRVRARRAAGRAATCPQDWADVSRRSARRSRSSDQRARLARHRGGGEKEAQRRSTVGRGCAGAYRAGRRSKSTHEGA